jgi:hypothetical protein
MPKAQKSSATSGTRKKNARKAASTIPHPEIPVIPKQKKQKGQKKEPRKKVYIPPSKPAPPQPDPLDTLGLAHQLPPELVIILRSLGKKDPITKGRALEELQLKWIDECSKKGDESVECDALVTMLPVWVRRLAAMVHALMLTVTSFIGFLYFSHIPFAGSASWLLHSITHTCAYLLSGMPPPSF